MSGLPGWNTAFDNEIADLEHHLKFRPMSELVNQTRHVHVAAMIDYYYRHNPAGGSLHIVLDDGNTETVHVWYCVGWALERMDRMGVLIGLRLLGMNECDRTTMYAELWQPLRPEQYTGPHTEPR